MEMGQPEKVALFEIISKKKRKKMIAKADTTLAFALFCDTKP